MDKEERAKYNCEKDKEHLEKFQNGKSPLFLTEKARKDLYSIIAMVAIEILVFSLAFNGFQAAYNDSLNSINKKLYDQVDSYIKADFKNMSCFDKINFIEKYNSDPSIAVNDKMKSWLQGNFDSTCSSYNDKK